MFLLEVKKVGSERHSYTLDVAHGNSTAKLQKYPCELEKNCACRRKLGQHISGYPIIDNLLRLINKMKLDLSKPHKKVLVMPYKTLHKN